MKYLRTKLATNWEEEKELSLRVLEKILSFIPKANPGYDNKMHLVREWIIEFDEENLPCREVGLDAKRNPVFSGPCEKNYGFWLDTNMKYSDFEGVEIDSTEFEKFWLKSRAQAIT